MSSKESQVLTRFLIVTLRPTDALLNICFYTHHHLLVSKTFSVASLLLQIFSDDIHSL